MGNSSSGARYYGKWKDSPHCFCDKSHWRCYHIHHQVVQMVENRGELTFRHECVKLQTKCEICSLVFYITIENGSDAGVQLHHGLYLKELDVAQNQDIDMSYAEVFDIYESLCRREKKYNLLLYNCQHFALDCYHSIRLNETVFYYPHTLLVEL